MTVPMRVVQSDYDSDQFVSPLSCLVPLARIPNMDPDLVTTLLCAPFAVAAHHWTLQPSRPTFEGIFQAACATCPITALVVWRLNVLAYIASLDVLFVAQFPAFSRDVQHWLDCQLPLFHAIHNSPAETQVRERGASCSPGLHSLTPSPPPPRWATWCATICCRRRSPCATSPST